LSSPVRIGLWPVINAAGPTVRQKPRKTADYSRAPRSNEPAIEWRKSARYEVRTRTYGLRSPRILSWSDSRKTEENCRFFNARARVSWLKMPDRQLAIVAALDQAAQTQPHDLRSQAHLTSLLLFWLQSMAV
jgi:hypothetical protein